MKTKKNLSVSLLMICFVFSLAGAQDRAKNNTDDANCTVEQKNAIFSEIMLSMPRDMQKRIDSASTSSVKNEAPAKNKAEKVQKQETTDKKRAVDELPAEIREKVQQRMAEIENNNEKRTVQLKEQIMEQKHKQSSQPQ